MAETDFTYGPARVPKPEDYTDHRAETYITGYATKIREDLERVFELYSGKLAWIYKPANSGPCTTCVDTLTGNIMLNKCPVCGGSRKASGYTKIAEKWALVEITPEYQLSNEMGNSDSPGGPSTPITVVGMPLLKEGYLIVTYNSKDVYKIVDKEPQIVALQGEVISQVFQTYRLSSESPEYSLITW